MFNWVCPQCGHDVPPSKTECPFCAEQAKQTGAPPKASETAYPGWQQPGPSAPPSPPAWNPSSAQSYPGWAPASQAPGWPPSSEPPSAPSQQQRGWTAPEQTQPWQLSPTAEAPKTEQTRPLYPVGPSPAVPPSTHAAAPPSPLHAGAPPSWGAPQQGYPPPQPHPPGIAPHGAPPRAAPPGWPPQPARPGLPTWALTVIFAAAFLGIGTAVYFGIQRFSRTNPAERTGVQEPSTAGAGKTTNPLQKVVEVVGVRIFTEKSKPIVRFVVVNHSNTDIENLGANVTLWASTSRSEEDAVGSFSFKAGTLAPEESKELTEPLKTKLKPYEWPDWQNLTADVSITSPQQ